MIGKYKRNRVLLIIIILVVSFAFINFLIFTYLFDYFLITEDLSIKRKYKLFDIDEKVYIIPYVGDFDGSVSEDWFYFYDKLIDFHEENNIPLSVSFFPDTIGDDEEFDKIMLKIHNSRNIQLIQKGFKGDKIEKEMFRLSKLDQKKIIKKGQDVYIERVDKILKKGSGVKKYFAKIFNSGLKVKPLIVYNQIGGKINNDTIEVLNELGFKVYFDVFLEEGFSSIDSTDDLYVLEYGVGFTISGDAGRKTVFRSPYNMTDEINNYTREDVTVLKINGRNVLPLWVHQQDFESKSKINEIDNEKWELYTFMLTALKNNKKIHLIGAEEIYKIKNKNKFGIK